MLGAERKVQFMDPKHVTRYIRPKDIPDLDESILHPIIKKTSLDLAESNPELTEDEWAESLMKSVIDGDLLIVIDDNNKRIGIVRSDRPPFLGLDDEAIGKPSHADPLNLKRWENKDKQ